MARWILQYAILAITGAAAAHTSITRTLPEQYVGPDACGIAVIVSPSPIAYVVSRAVSQALCKADSRILRLTPVLFVHCGLPLSVGAVMCSLVHAVIHPNSIALSVAASAFNQVVAAAAMIDAVRTIHAEKAEAQSPPDVV